MNREQCNALIERLADKTLSFGCLVNIKEDGEWLHNMQFTNSNIKSGYIDCVDDEYVAHGNIYEILGHPVYIGNVIQKIRKEHGYVFNHKVYFDLLCWWHGDDGNGHSKSLQTILEEAEWEPCDPDCTSECNDATLKSPAKELFEYLITLFL